MDETERERYGRLLCIDVAELDAGLTFDSDFASHLPDWIVEKHARYAERFIATAGLVPLDEVRALAEEALEYVEVNGDIRNSHYAHLIAILRDDLLALGKRFGKEE